MNRIAKFRKSIDEIDNRILGLLSDRQNAVKKIAAIKKELGLPVFDRKREDELLERISKKSNQLGIDSGNMLGIFNSILSGSRTEQQKSMQKIKCSVKSLGLIGFGRFGKL